MGKAHAHRLGQVSVSELRAISFNQDRWRQVEEACRFVEQTVASPRSERSATRLLSVERGTLVTAG